VPEDIFCELYRELAQALQDKPSVEALADIIDNPVQSREAFEQTDANDCTGERALVAFVEAGHSALVELAGDELSNRYVDLLAGFTSDGPGIRHGGKPANALRAVDMRDMVAMSILLAGFTPYLAAQLNADSVYRGA